MAANLESAKYASLSPDEEQVLHEIEDDLGNVYVIAYDQPLMPARLSDEQLQQLREAENKMHDKVLVAYRKTP